MSPHRGSSQNDAARPAPQFAASATALAAVSARRRRADRVARGVVLAFTLVAVVPLVLILYFLVKEGLGAWSADFFTTDPTGRFLGDPGGIRSAIWARSRWWRSRR